MKAAVGYSDHPDTIKAGRQAAQEAMRNARRNDPCDLALLFATSHHDAVILRDAVAGIVGSAARIVGGGAVGTITNDHYGYAGDQVSIACFWLDGLPVNIFDEAGMRDSEFEVGRRLGQTMISSEIDRDTSVMLFYDSIDRTGGNVRLLMASQLLAGINDARGFIPDNLVGAGLMGDYACTSTSQWTGNGVADGHAMLLHFPDDIKIDNIIMHGCRPATGYYTVTKAEGPVILEINNEPAIQFLDRMLGPAVTHERFPFFLLLGINNGERWGEFKEHQYASRLCLGLDMDRGGIVMFESDMTAGTEFQIMYRSLDLEYMRPRIEKVFEQLDGREPVFAFYIDCAGRAAGYGGVDIEDAVMVQNTVAGRVPLLGIYSGVEIAAVSGPPRGLDWTGVFCLFSVAEKEAP